MSGVVALRAALIGLETITSSIPSARIYIGVLPLSVALPAITLTTVSATPRNTIGMQEAQHLNRERVQVTVYAKTYPQLDEVIRTLSRSLKNQRLTVEGLLVQSIIPAGTGPDFEGVDPVMFIRSADYFVSYLV